MTSATTRSGPATDAGAGDGRRDVLISLGAPALVVAIALIGLGSDGNWPKVIRVGLSFSAYAATLATLQILQRPSLAARGAPFPWFFAAGCLAGIVSGLLRPVIDPAPLVVGALGAGTLFGGVHWLALRRWRARPHGRLTTCG